MDRTELLCNNGTNMQLVEILSMAGFVINSAEFSEV